MKKQMTFRPGGMVHLSTKRISWHFMNWKVVQRELQRLHMGIANAVLTAGLLQPGQPCEMLEPYNEKSSRTVLGAIGA